MRNLLTEDPDLFSFCIDKLDFDCMLWGNVYLSYMLDNIFGLNGDILCVHAEINFFEPNRVLYAVKLFTLNLRLLYFYGLDSNPRPLV